VTFDRKRAVLHRSTNARSKYMEIYNCALDFSVTKLTSAKGGGKKIEWEYFFRFHPAAVFCSGAKVT